MEHHILSVIDRDEELDVIEEMLLSQFSHVELVPKLIAVADDPQVNHRAKRHANALLNKIEGTCDANVLH